MATLSAKEQTVASFLKGHGLTDAQVAGVMGNWRWETGGFTDKNLYGTGWDVNGPSGGLAQWHNERLTAEQNWVHAQGGTGLGTLDQQLQYAWQEIQKSYPNAISTSTDPAVAASTFNRVFEGGTDPGGVREQYAKTYLPSLSGVQASSTGGGVGGLIGGAISASQTGGHAILNGLGKITGLSGPINAVESTASATETIATDLGKATLWIAQPKNWLRVGYFVLGAILVVVGGAKAVGAPNPVSFGGPQPGVLVGKTPPIPRIP